MALAERRKHLSAHPWTWLRQVHGRVVVTVDEPGQHAGVEGDALVTAVPGAVLAIQTADCAPVVLLGSASVGAVHAGWAGARDGVLQAAVAALRDLDDGPVAAVLGPCIHAGGYAFGEEDLRVMVDRYGDGVRGVDRFGSPALSMPAVVRAALAEVGVVDIVQLDGDTSADERWFSHRTRRDLQRQTSVVWIEPT